MLRVKDRMKYTERLADQPYTASLTELLLTSLVQNLSLSVYPDTIMLWGTDTQIKSLRHMCTGMLTALTDNEKYCNIVIFH